MKKIGLISLIFIYASFALVCFASVVAPKLSHTDTVAPISHESHTGHQISPSLHCQLTPAGCVSDPLATVFGHAEMYDLITAVELVSLCALFLFVVVLFFYLHRLFRQCIIYTQGIWYQYKPKEPCFSLTLDYLAWTAFHTRSPNYIFVVS
jgi:hypothetical protein